jgi:hypothetical protein
MILTAPGVQNVAEGKPGAVSKSEVLIAHAFVASD